MKKYVAGMLAVVMLLCLCLTACTGVDVTTIATVNGEKIKKNEYSYFLTMFQTNMAQQLSQSAEGGSIWDTDVDGQNAGDYVKENAMTAMIQMEVLVQKANEMGLTLTADDKKQATEIKKQLAESLGGTTEYKAFLKEISMTENEMATLCQKQVLATKVQGEVEKTDPAFTNVSEEAVGKYYTENYFKAKHILILSSPETASAPEAAEGADATGATDENAAPEEVAEPAETAAPEVTLSPEEYKEEAKTKAQGILDQIKGGADFDALMNQYSEDPGLETSPNGYVFTEGQMVSEFEDAVKALENDKVTEELVETDYGFHIIKRLALTAQDEDFTSKYDNYKTEYTNKMFSDMLDQWVKEANVEKNESAVAKIKLKD